MARIPFFAPIKKSLSERMEPVWLVWARELQAIAQTGLTFATSAYDRGRYTAIRALAAQIMATQSDADFGRVEALFAEQNGYATPKVDVRGAIFDEDTRVLLFSLLIAP